MSLRAAEIPKNELWTRSIIVPLPTITDGVNKPVIPLHGTWKINLSPPESFASNDVDVSNWRDVCVPGQIDRQGFGARGGRRGGGNGQAGAASQPAGGRRGGGPGPTPYVYKTKLDIPPDFSGKRIFIQFQGVTGTATVWVNGTQVGAPHIGGFTLWDVDITEQVKPGGNNWLTVQVKEPSNNDSSVGARYPGGIIRNLDLVAVPQEHITRFNIETDFDANYQNSTMKVWVGAALKNNATVALTLTAPDGAKVSLSPGNVNLTAAQSELIADIPVSAPIKWDAEHPNLYTLEASLVQNGQTTETISKKIGFRKVVVDGRRLLVNGKEIKMRGAGQFDSDALDGRTLYPGEAEEDVNLYKAANMNYARPAVYPANVEFLEACDKYGLYVECECPVWNSGTPDMTPIYLSQTSEMVEAYRSHPSIIMWNLANETGYSINIRREGEYIHAEDKSRPVVFSWSHSVTPGDPLPYDIYSYHYPSWDDDLGKPGVAVFNGGGRGLQIPVPPMPVLADEFAHPSAYNNEERARDPNVRAFWGEGINQFWERMFTTEGSLGGAIWGFDDDPINSSENVYGWGLVDVWRRQKPEYYMAKKAYSPVRLEDKAVANPGVGKVLALPIKNWFDHSNLSELLVTWEVGAETGTMPGPDVQPHANGTLNLPARQWKQGDVVNIKFSAAGFLYDEYNISIDPAPVRLSGPVGPAPRLADRADQITITGDEFSITFDKKSGSISNGAFKGTTLLKGGPYLNVIGVTLSDWAVKQISARTEDNEAVLSIAGTYSATPEAVGGRGGRGRGAPQAAQPSSNPSTVEVHFEVHIDGTGAIVTRYTLDKFDLTPPEPRVVPWNNTNAGGYQEVGVSYLVTGQVDQLAWRRKGYWSVYPDDHIARVRGIAVRKGQTPQVDVKPTWNWSQDETPAGQGSNDFRSQKENIYFASAIVSGSNLGIRAESAGTDAVRIEAADASQLNSDLRLNINNLWNYRNLGLGNYMKPPVIVKGGYTNSVRIRLTDDPNANDR
ncbi:MAG TPA: glycoside hydrolase family 2 TIM barrel-domain containing protein [Tepidisphaeraceae bacterium]|nr:glycoside hydrolase family 2 TIM barrel-domain containing protein [Tepidisphaeraceae bacterium]